MKRLILTALLAGFAAFHVSAADAAGRHDASRDSGFNARRHVNAYQAGHIDTRQHQQQQRIAQGLRSGALTPLEARGLRQEQRRIRHKENAYRADGVLTRWELADLQRDLNRANHRIYQEKHDRQRRYY